MGFQDNTFEAPYYPEESAWYQDVMYFMLKRFKGAISYTEFYEMIDDDLWVLYNKEIELIKEEEKIAKGNNKENTSNVPEPELPPEDPEAVSFVDELLGD